MTYTLRVLVSLVSVSSVIACGVEADDEEVGTLAEELVREGSPEAVAMLGYLNGADANYRNLRDDVGLSHKAAFNIVGRVRGRDARLGTADDKPLQTIAQLDAIAYIGDTAMNAILDYVRASGLLPSTITVEGVTFQPAEATKAVAIANRSTSTATYLRTTVGLTSTAAASLVRNRPFANLAAVAAAPSIGKTALQKLLAQAKVELASGPTTPATTTIALTPLTVPGPSSAEDLWGFLTATHGTYATAEVVQVPQGFDAGNAAQMESLAATITKRIAWYWPSHDARMPAPARQAWTTGSPLIAAALNEDFNEVFNNTEGMDPDSGWTDESIHDRATDALNGLLGSSRTRPAGYREFRMRLEADECSEKGHALLDTATGRVVIIHYFPHCG